MSSLSEAAKLGPVFAETNFKCAFCEAYSQHLWFRTGAFMYYSGKPSVEVLSISPSQNFTGNSVGGLAMSRCVACGDAAVWLSGRLIWPASTRSAPRAAADMPPAVLDDYEEAASICVKSPRAAAALLRLALEKLCHALGKSGTINLMIGDLVKDGLPSRAQQAFDAVRVIGNEAVHPGEIDLRDDLDTVLTLFKLLNLIVEKVITEPKEIDQIYSGLPPGKLKGIEDRDG